MPGAAPQRWSGQPLRDRSPSGSGWDGDDFTVPGSLIAATPVSCDVLGLLSGLTLPADNLGSELVTAAGTYTLFEATREVAETDATKTTIQLTLNGADVAGASLSWDSGDAAFDVQSLAISQAVVAGDRMAIKVTSAGASADTVRARVS